MDLRTSRTQAHMLKMRTTTNTLPGSWLESHACELDKLPIGQLRDNFLEVMGYTSRSRNRTFLIRKILWGLQAQKSGDISAAARKKAIELADERDVITRLPKVSSLQDKPSRKKSYRFSPSNDSRLPVPGSVLTRQYKGKGIRVTVHADDFEYNGDRYRSLSSIARKITGGSYNGFLFFKLK